MAKSENQNSNGHSPDFIVYTVRDHQDENRKANWTRVGAAWSHKDCKGFNITLDALPVSGKLTIRKYEPKANNEEQGA